VNNRRPPRACRSLGVISVAIGIAWEDGFAGAFSESLRTDATRFRNSSNEAAAQQVNSHQQAEILPPQECRRFRLIASSAERSVSCGVEGTMHPDTEQ
jgi:hypothetical protein